MVLGLDNKIYTRFEGTGLDDILKRLLYEQLESWQLLKQSYDALSGVKIREIYHNDFYLRVQHNPGRKTSALADTRQAAIERRPCFLCIQNIPEHQKGILYKEYLILCNPAPVFYHHLTINSIKHKPQRIDTNIDSLLQLAIDLGQNWLILYNGPECGASAPDHLHFQAIPNGNTPLEQYLRIRKGLKHIKDISGVSVYSMENMGREIIILEGFNVEYIGYVFQSIFNRLRLAFKTSGEPMMNIVCFKQDKTLTLCVFPRKKHRPDVFFKEGENRVVISPGAIEMTGVIVTPMEKDFLSLDGHTLESIYKEVSVNKIFWEHLLDL